MNGINTASKLRMPASIAVTDPLIQSLKNPILSRANLCDMRLIAGDPRRRFQRLRLKHGLRGHGNIVLVGLRRLRCVAGLCAGAASPVVLFFARGALYGFGCGLPLDRGSARTPPGRPSLTTWTTGRSPGVSAQGGMSGASRRAIASCYLPGDLNQADVMSWGGRPYLFLYKETFPVSRRLMPKAWWLGINGCSGVVRHAVLFLCVPGPLLDGQRLHRAAVAVAQA